MMKVFYCLGKKDFCFDEDSLCCVCTHCNDGGGEYRECEIVEAKHGEWIDKQNPQWKAYDIRHCSECGWNIPKNNLRKKDLNWGWCPNCGAKMDGGVKDGKV